MNRQEFKKWALSALRMFDGSTGNTLSRRGMPAGAVPEQWIIENPDVLIELQREFIDAGTEVMLTATLGATAPKLAEYGITDVEGYNRKLFEITKQAVGEKTRIAAELGPTGKFMAPMGDKSFEDMVGIYKQQVAALLPCKPDMFILETFIDLAEARAAVIAIRDLCDLPVIASMTFQNGMTLTGSTPEAVAVTLTAAGADAVGANCSTGPQGVAEVVAKMAAVCDLPLFAKPNAGMPQLIDGRTVFRMGPEEFAKEALALVKAGATLVGGCCGATPEHIKEFKQRIRDLEPAPRAQVQKAYVSSPRQALEISVDTPLRIVGEGINPTGRKNLAKSFVDSDIMPAVELAGQQVEDGADLLDINVSAAGADEISIMAMLASQLPVYCPAPLCFDSTNAEVMEIALRNYCGRAILNSASAEPGRMEPMLALAKKYGAVVILLPFKDGIPQTAEDRLMAANELIDAAGRAGLNKSDIIIDGAIMAAATDTGSPGEALKFVSQMHARGYMTIAGVSNVSFGLPDRESLNTVFLTMLVSHGLSLAIARPGEAASLIREASSVLMGRDEWCMNWIERSRKGKEFLRD